MRDWLSVLSRQKWILLAAVIVVPLLAFAVSRGQERLYEASANVLINEQNPTAAALNLQSGVSSPPDRFAATQATLARGRPVAQMAVKAANLPDRTAAALLANSTVKANLNADVLTFSVTDQNPIVAKKLATAYATQFTVYRHMLDTKALSAAIADVGRKLKAIVASGGTGSLLYTRLTGQASDLEALQTVQAAGSSAVLVDSANTASLVQPKTRRNVILGVMVGLALGIALAFLRESLDTRVHSAEELRTRLGLPLLGQIPKPDRRIAQAQQLATLSDPTGSGNEAFRILKTNLEISQLQHHAGSIVITSTTRGEDKSTTAANLAVILARSGRHVILVDLDLRHPSIDRLFDLGDRPGLTSVAGGVALVDALSAVDVHPDRSTEAAGKLEVVTAGPPPPDPGEFLLSSFVPDALAALAGRCDRASDRHASRVGSGGRDRGRDAHGRADPRRGGEPGTPRDSRRDPPRARGLPHAQAGLHRNRDQHDGAWHPSSGLPRGVDTDIQQVRQAGPRAQGADENSARTRTRGWQP